MIVWGGHDANDLLDTGGIYDPATDTWTATSVQGAPLDRNQSTVVWTGSKMILWGGDDGSGTVNTGGVYDPAADAWTTTSTVGAPSGRYDHSAVRMGSKMVVWGGFRSSPSGELNTGGIYDPAADSWTATTTVGAPAAREGHTAVWTGSSMIVWGGYDYFADSYLNTGGAYSPPGAGFYTVSPCRVLDSRDPAGPWGGQPLAAGQERTLTVVGEACGIPATATGLSYNITAASATATGHLRVYPAGVARPGASTLNFTAGLTRANNGIVPLGAGGDVAIYSGQATGSVHVIVDVNGYFE
jgi:N-acetylneuraminic acid mutarotase